MFNTFHTFYILLIFAIFSIHLYNLLCTFMHFYIFCILYTCLCLYTDRSMNSKRFSLCIYAFIRTLYRGITYHIISSCLILSQQLVLVPGEPTPSRGTVDGRSFASKKIETMLHWGLDFCKFLYVLSYCFGASLYFCMFFIFFGSKIDSW